MDEMHAAARRHAMSLVLMGVALAKNGDSKRVVEQLLPELLTGTGPSQGLRAVKERDRKGVEEFMAYIGVQMLESETAVDAIIRTHLRDEKQRLQRQLAAVEAAWTNEEKRAAEKAGV